MIGGETISRGVLYLNVFLLGGGRPTLTLVQLRFGRAGADQSRHFELSFKGRECQK